jgi:hypothetical protein
MELPLRVNGTPTGSCSTTAMGIWLRSKPLRAIKAASSSSKAVRSARSGAMGRRARACN